MFSEMFNEAISEPRLASPELVWSESIPVQPQCSIVKELLPKAMLQFYRYGGAPSLVLLRGSSVSIQGGTARRGQGARSRAYPEGTDATRNAAIVDAGPFWCHGTYAKVHLGAREVGTLEVDELDVLDALQPIIALRSPRRLFLFADARLFL